MLYELRVYHMYPGRLDAIHKRFREATLRLFEKHGIRVCDFFTDAGDSETIYYICGFEDRANRDRAFEAFGNDPEWKAVYAASHADGGPIVEKIDSYFMTRVPYCTPAWNQGPSE